MDALARQEGEVTWEVVVVLDGDMDASRAVLDTYLSQVPLTIVELAENRGRQPRSTQASPRLGAQFWFAATTTWSRHPTTWRDMPRGTPARRSASSACTGTCFPKPCMRDLRPRVGRRLPSRGLQTPPDRAWQYWAGNCSLTRSTWEAAGPYDDEFRSYGYEDVDFGYRVASLGVPIVLDRRLETEHRIAATTTSGRAQRAFYSGAAKRRFELKHGLVAPPRPRNPWDRLVSALARHLDEERAQTVGSVVDVSARGAPDGLTGKAVAMLVEAASRAGHSSGQTQGDI